MKILFQLIFAFILSLIISNFSHYRPSETAINVLYTVSGILFSVGLGLIITLVPNGIKNVAYIKSIRDTINNVRNHFFAEFTIATIMFVIFTKPADWTIYEWSIYIHAIKFDPIVMSSLVILFSLPYFVLNFLAIQKLNNDIFDKVNNENSY